MITDTISIGVQGSDSIRLTGSSQEVGSSRITVSASVPASTTNQAVTAAFVVANIQSCILVATSSMTIKTNSTSSPGDTISLVAGIPYLFRRSAGYGSFLFTVDVTIWYVSATAAGQLNASFLSS